MNDTPRTNDQSVRYYDDATGTRIEYVASRFARQLERELTQRERERDKWKARYIQQNKELGCEMMDPNGTIWDHAKNLQDQIRAMKKMILRIGYPARGSADESADVFAFASEIAGTWSLEDLTNRNEP